MEILAFCFTLFECLFQFHSFMGLVVLISQSVSTFCSTPHIVEENLQDGAFFLSSISIFDLGVLLLKSQK